MKKMIKLLTAAVCSVMMISAAAPCVSADWEKADGNTKYFVEDTGSYAKGFMDINGSKYYFDKNGNMKTGWVKFKDGRKYLFGKNGAARTGMVKYKNGNTYWFDEEGLMVTGWYKTADGIYFMKDNGVMVKGRKLVVDEILYEFDDNGIVTPIIYSKKMQSKKPGDFHDPEFGMSLKEMTKYCGYGKVKQIDERTFSGNVKYFGIESELVTSFNEIGQLYYWQLGIPLPRSAFDDTLANIKEMDENFNVTEGVYYWVVKDPDGSLHSNLFLKYDDQNGILYYGWSSYVYSD